MKRGEIRWYAFRPPDKRRPVLLMTRDEVIEELGELVAVPITRTVRGLATEVLLTQDDGMPMFCARTSTTWASRNGPASAHASPTFVLTVGQRFGAPCSSRVGSRRADLGTERPPPGEAAFSERARAGAAPDEGAGHSPRGLTEQLDPASCAGDSCG